MQPITALVTGASRGIGYAIARRLAPLSSNLLVCSRRKSLIAKATSSLQKETAGKVVCHAADHTAPQRAAKSVASWAHTKASAIDVLVLNAGYYVEGTLASISDKDFEKNFRVNFLANHYLVKELLPLVRKSTMRRIILIGSTAAYEAYPAVPTYGVAKWALRGYASNLRRELMHEGIGVTFVAPGGTLTDMWEGVALPENRLLDPDDIAVLVAATLSTTAQAVVEEIIVRPMLGDMHD